MKFVDWHRLAGKGERKELAKKCNTTVGYLIQLAGGHRKPSPGLARKLESATNGAVSRKDLRPDIWDDVA